jgi:hypothetical protein
MSERTERHSAAGETSERGPSVPARQTQERAV